VKGLESHVSNICYAYVNVVFYDLCARNNIYNILENSCLGPIDN